MQLSIKVTGQGAGVVSHLISKNPHNLYERNEKGHTVRLVYTTSSEEETEFLLYVVPDPIELVRNSPDLYNITQYINDREFAVSSLFCSFIRTALGTALNGKPKEEYRSWVDHELQLELRFGPLASSLSDKQIQQLFEPLGYKIGIDYGDFTVFKEKSTARYLTIKGTKTLQTSLRHVFVLIPVLDDYKHYFIDEREVEKLERYGEGWLEFHPLADLIIKRSLRFRDVIAKSNFKVSDEKDLNFRNKAPSKPRLNDMRYEAIVKQVQSLTNKSTVIDMGAGEGKLSVQLGFIPGIQEILAVEPSQREHIRAKERFEKAKQIEGFLEPSLLWGSLFYTDDRLRNKDVMILCEVIEHINEDRLPGIMELIFRENRPRTFLITTPNQEYNAIYDLGENMRHNDHRFEWSREEFQNRCQNWIANVPYSVVFAGIGEEQEPYGFPTQMAIFSRREEE
jgi:3' terminal RNA ribose 2'-O-methyltransferase Hen1